MNTLIRALKSALGVGRRYGVRFASGSKERTGFYSQREAREWLSDRGYVGVVFMYAPLDLRIDTSAPTRPYFCG
jgi:hypothetical protein